MIHLNTVKGDYLFKAWDETAYEKMKNKVKELEALGYIFIGNEHDWLDTYYYYKNDKGETVTLTVMCC